LTDLSLNIKLSGQMMMSINGYVREMSKNRIDVLVGISTVLPIVAFLGLRAAAIHVTDGSSSALRRLAWPWTAGMIAILVVAGLIGALCLVRSWSAGRQKRWVAAILMFIASLIGGAPVLFMLFAWMIASALRAAV
jgi:hypothetical protein